MKKNHSNEFEIDLRQMILAIEDAVSLVGMNDTNHGKRVGYIACQLGTELGLSESQRQYLFDLGLLHDCGVSTQQMHASLVNYFDWNDAHIHCEIGYDLLKNFKPLAHFATPILYHHK
jgi:HD-GYP domain-containing protein (c-di-GMP phosphodiesterase class II)